jgi:hypothetical protein
MALEKIAASLALLGIPWASSWKRIDWHFKWGTKSQSGVFNGVASVLAAILFTASVFRPPARWVVLLPEWIGFLAASLLASAYVWLLHRYKEPVEKKQMLWPLVLGLILYTWLWGLVAVYTRQAYIFRDYHVYGGHVLDSGQPAVGKRIQMVDASGREDGMPEDVTDAKGKWLIFWRATSDHRAAEVKIVLSDDRFPKRSLEAWEDRTDIPFAFNANDQ